MNSKLFRPVNGDLMKIGSQAPLQVGARSYASVN